jgi:hypothetical protein
MLLPVVCKPSFPCGQDSDHRVDEQRSLYLNQELPHWDYFCHLLSPPTVITSTAVSGIWWGVGWGERTLQPATHSEPKAVIPTQRLGTSDLICLHIKCLELISSQFEKKFCYICHKNQCIFCPSKSSMSTNESKHLYICEKVWFIQVLGHGGKKCWSMQKN